MIKECNVIMNNQKVAVIQFDDVKVQVPSSELIGDTAYIKLENDKYTVVSKAEYQSEKKKAKATKKKNIEIDTENNADTVVIDNVDDN